MLAFKHLTLILPCNGHTKSNMEMNPCPVKLRIPSRHISIIPCPLLRFFPLQSARSGQFSGSCGPIKSGTRNKLLHPSYFFCFAFACSPSVCPLLALPRPDGTEMRFLPCNIRLDISGKGFTLETNMVAEELTKHQFYLMAHKEGKRRRRQPERFSNTASRRPREEFSPRALSSSLERGLRRQRH